MAKFDFTYVDRANGYINRTNFGMRKGHGRKNRGAGSAVRYPAIIITLA